MHKMPLSPHTPQYHNKPFQLIGPTYNLDITLPGQLIIPSLSYSSFHALQIIGLLAIWGKILVFVPKGLFGILTYYVRS